ncbi:zinc-dependent metalloprotease [Actinomycetospora straminea]|uniref:Zinc-dependent metalloprotease n=1 Tax=Actinomycetospora straminea TaxID=663607 RepID=A0ABP9E7X8_9PSEU|nr:zinc-dependent metalloprotease [Actinomycetospora straminea]MDD7935279.1 zinc-dependent metalloprotease [Actinomycetospora straminea]
MSVELTSAPRDGTGLPVDWGLAAATGARLVPAGPAVSPAEAAAEVSRLREGARIGEGHVRELTGLGAGLPVPEADVVDRPGWIRSAVGGIATLLEDAPLPGPPAGIVGSAFGRVTRTAAGVQMGTLLAFLGSRVLGQYDPFGGPERAGRLLLVAPNVVAARQALDVDADDFALWVCLHEATHRLQFTAVDWLRDHFRDEVAAFAGGFDRTASGAVDRLPEIVKAVRHDPPRDGLALVEMFQGPEQRAVLDRLLALTTLLEGHAEHVMDAVGPAVVPSVAAIRARFTTRRRGGSLVDRLLRTLLGVDAKIRQYEQGRVFVDRVVDRVGLDGLNAVWTSPDTLPRRAEITDPDTWVGRVHG